VVGKRIVDLQTSMALVASPESPFKEQNPDGYGRVPFQHPQLSGLSNLSEATKAEVLSKQRMAQLAGKYGITGVLRWKPKKVSIYSHLDQQRCSVANDG
jgi:large subunit ribosomal protein L15